MKSNNKLILLALVLSLLAACGGSGCGSGSPAPSLVAITVTPDRPFIALGTSAQFTATGSYSDNSTRDLTSSVSWGSSDSSVATINSAGTATSISPGVTAVTAASGGISGSTPLTVSAAGTTAVKNVLPITVNGSLCSPATSGGYLNKPCVSVTVCAPGSTTDCQTINDILLDTGSSGLRIFNQVLTNPSFVLSGVTTGTGFLAECATFADGSTDWGPIKRADVRLGNEPAVTVSIHVIDAGFGTVPAACGTPDTSPSTAGFNGILGVGLFSQDCGAQCTIAGLSLPPVYFSCKGTVCAKTTAPLTDQVTNPVTKLPVDNNGVLIQLPSVLLGGAPSLSGKLILGIGTAPNNAPSASIKAYPTSPSGEITTTLNGVPYTHSIIDSGSNGLFFPPPSVSQLPNCAAPNGNWFCPVSTVTLSATNAGTLGTPSGPVSFQIGNFTGLINSSSMVFSEAGGSAPGLFDWGLPFYFGREVYVGVEGQTNATLGTGPYIAY